MKRFLAVAVSLAVLIGSASSVAAGNLDNRPFDAAATGHGNAASAASAAAVSGPDGFAFVPWGASGSQVNEAMMARGFHVKSGTGGGLQSYYGTLDGTPGRFDFWFEKGSFWEGDFVYFGKFDVSEVRGLAADFKEKIEAKYGPGKFGNSSVARGQGWIWDGLHAPGTSDMVQIKVVAFLNSYPHGTVVVSYKNEGLHRRLLGQEKNGL